MMKPLLALILLCFTLSSHGKGGLFVTGSPPQAGTATFGALAFNAKTRAWAYVVKSADKTRALVAVAKLCPDCVADGPFEHCGVLAGGAASLLIGTGGDHKAAEEMALSKCGPSCEPVTWFCNSAGSR